MPRPNAHNLRLRVSSSFVSPFGGISTAGQRGNQATGSSDSYFKHNEDTAILDKLGFVPLGTTASPRSSQKSPRKDPAWEAAVETTDSGRSSKEPLVKSRYMYRPPFYQGGRLKPGPSKSSSSSSSVATAERQKRVPKGGLAVASVRRTGSAQMSPLEVPLEVPLEASRAPSTVSPLKKAQSVDGALLNPLRQWFSNTQSHRRVEEEESPRRVEAQRGNGPPPEASAESGGSDKDWNMAWQEVRLTCFYQSTTQSKPRISGTKMFV